LINRILRGLSLALYGIELGADIELGTGVYFVHSTGTVVGGKSVIGNRVRLFGCNTIGTAKEDGEPKIGNDVRIGAGARVLGPITIGDRVVIGANAVVLKSLEAGVTAVGIPAKVTP
jgi:serine acetyltransferase